MELCEQRDISAISVHDITEHADVGHGTFYNHFSSKQALMSEMANSFLSIYRDKLATLVAETEDSAIRFLITYHVTLEIACHFQLWQIIQQSKNGELRKNIKDLLVQEINHAIKKDRFKVDDASLFSTFVDSTTFGIMTKLAEELITLKEATLLGMNFLSLVGINGDDVMTVQKETWDRLNFDPL